MSVLVKGMEIPKGCASCFLKYGSCASIRKRTDVSKGDRWCPENYRHPDCPLIEVPEDVQPVKHGRWIKARGSWCTPGGDPVWECSECGKGIHVYGIEHGTYGSDVADGQWVACPNCGAKVEDGT